jgi:hypothetical protein
MMSTRSVMVVLALASALACETPPVSPAELATATPVVAPAHPSPDPPPGKPVLVEEPDAAVVADADGGAIAEGGADAGATATATAPATLPIANADDVIASLRPRFKTCYERGLATDRNQRGRLLLSASISPEGDVVSASPSNVEGLNNAVVGCMVGVLKGAHFSAPGGRGTTLQVPLTFAPP